MGGVLPFPRSRAGRGPRLGGIPHGHRNQTRGRSAGGTPDRCGPGLRAAAGPRRSGTDRKGRNRNRWGDSATHGAASGGRGSLRASPREGLRDPRAAARGDVSALASQHGPLPPRAAPRRPARPAFPGTQLPPALSRWHGRRVDGSRGARPPARPDRAGSSGTSPRGGWKRSLQRLHRRPGSDARRRDQSPRAADGPTRRAALLADADEGPPTFRKGRPPCRRVESRLA